MSIDCFKITNRIINKKKYQLLSKTDFEYTSSKKAEELIGQIRLTTNDYVILSLWVVFERRLFEYVQKEIQSFPSKNVFSTKVQEKLENNIETWRLTDVLDIFKAIVDSSLIGRAKQIKKYRDWVAHKNPNKGMPENITPQYAYNTLSNILESLELNKI